MKHFAVMLRGNTGTRRLVGDGWSSYWENNTHVVTWCIEETLTAAEITASELRSGRSRDISRVWIEER